MSVITGRRLNYFFQKISEKFVSGGTVTGGDFNNMITPGIYTMRNITDHAPSTIKYYGLIVLRSDLRNSVLQIAIPESSTKVYVRHGINNAWGIWKQLLTKDDESELLAYKDISGYVNVNSQYFSMGHAYRENGMIVISGNIKSEFNGSNTLFTISSNLYTPRTRIFGSFGYSGVGDAGKIMTLSVNSNGTGQAWTNQALNNPTPVSFVYPERTE